MSDDFDTIDQFENVKIPTEDMELPNDDEGKTDEQLATGTIRSPKLDSFLMKWDRTLQLDRRCFGIKLCFAGADGREYRDGLYRIGVRNILISYFYSRKWLKKLTVQEIAEDLGRFDFVFLDSGGFSLIQAINGGKDLGMDVEEYTKDYYQELKRIGHLFAGCAEVDVHAKFTQYQMEEFKDDLLASNVPVVPVVQNESVNQLVEMGWYDKYPYIAIGSAMIGNPKHLADIIEITNKGREYGCVFHGFGATAADVVIRGKWYSIDSSVGGSSKVWFKQGPYPERISIEDLYNSFKDNEELVGFEGRVATPDSETLSVVEEDGKYVTKWVPLRSVVKHTVKKEFLKITVASGLSLEVTSDHSLFRMGPEGDLLETKPSLLEEGDWIVCPSRGKWLGQGLEKLEFSYSVPYLNNRWHDSPTEKLCVELDKEMLEFLGYWVGNGSFSSETSINCSCGLDKEPVELARLIASRFDRVLTEHEQGDTSFSSHSFARWLRAAGFPSGAANKAFPGWFWSLSEEQACHVLRGYFSSDGSAGDKPYTSSISEELSDQVFAALFLMGIPCSKGLSNTKHYRVTISSNEAKKKFESKIGFFTKRKVVTYRKEKRLPYHSRIPASLAHCRGRWISGDLWDSETEFVGRTDYTKYFNPGVYESELNYLKIIKIETLPLETREVYDLEVPGAERFIANEILAHNTTWVGGSRFGNTMVFQNGRIRYYDHTHKDVRRRFKTRLEENGIVWKDIEDDKRKEVDLMNALAWKQWADSIRFNVQNCYWLTPEEKDQALTLKSKVFNTEGLIDRKQSLARAESRRLALVDDARFDDRAHEILHCDTCFLSGRCPRYKAKEPCGYDINIRLETTADLHKAIQVVLEAEYGRVMTGVMFEKAQGGVLDANVSNEMQKFLGMVQQARVIFQPRAQEELVIQAKSSSSGSISKMLASVFAPTGHGTSGSGNTKAEREANRIINVTPSTKKSSDLNDSSLDEE
jgi:intein/homing endonuclease